MKQRHKTYFKLNITSLFFMALSFVSVTLAWFAYSGVVRFQTEVNIKAWNIEITKDGERINHNVVMSLSDIYPGMTPATEYITLRNHGDSDAEITYSILSARILDEQKDLYINSEEITSEKIEDVISQEYPFKINIELSDDYILAKSGVEETFKITVSWPLDSGDDLLDSYWGNKAHEFQSQELIKKESNSAYEIKPAIKVDIDLNAQQYLDNDESRDHRYNLGDEILIDVINNQTCETISETCIKTYVIDTNNKVKDTKITLLPNPFNTYTNTTQSEYENTINLYQTNWNVTVRPLKVEDTLKIISKDIKDSYIEIENHSDKIIGNLKYENRLSTVLQNTISKNGTFKFSNERFNFMTSNICYWIDTPYNELSTFALKKENEEIGRIYPEINIHTCNVIPVLEIEKTRI